MKCLLPIIAVLIVADRMCDASLAFEPNAAAPKNPGSCMSQQYQKIIKIGQSYPIPNECGVMSCDKSYTITYEGCSPMEMYDKNNVKCTKMVQNEDLPFPDCCPHPVCDDLYDNEQYDYDYYDKYNI